jgi:hypothetical protein
MSYSNAREGILVPPDDDDDYECICGHCNGSGEGMYDGTTCSACGGSGIERDDDDEGSDDYWETEGDNDDHRFF